MHTPHDQHRVSVGVLRIKIVTFGVLICVGPEQDLNKASMVFAYGESLLAGRFAGACVELASRHACSDPKLGVAQC